MDNTTIHEALEELRRQGAALSREVSDRKRQLEELESRLGKIHGAVHNLEALLGVDVGTDFAQNEKFTQISDGPNVGKSSNLGQGEMVDEGGLKVDSTGPTRTPSTENVARIVNESGRPMTREQIREEFQRRGWVPASWSNPINAINNAIARAVSKGMVYQEQGRFLPKDSRPQQPGENLFEDGG